MITLEGLSYAAVQVVHNFGAVTVLGGSAFALHPRMQSATLHRRLAWWVGFGWATQAMSGAGFAVVSYHFYGKLPDIHGIAMAALLLKMLCAVFGLSITVLYLKNSAFRNIRERSRLVWLVLVTLACTALTSAAVLRWFS